MLFDNIDTVVTLLWTMDRIGLCICIFLFFGVAIVLFSCFFLPWSVNSRLSLAFLRTHYRW